MDLLLRHAAAAQCRFGFPDLDDAEALHPVITAEPLQN
jgi:hypothetical protein